MKFKTFLVAGALLLLTSTITAQNYRTGVGARVGFFNGVTVKHFVSRNNAVEGLLSFRWDGIIVTGLYEWQYPILSVPRLDYYVGLGGHIGFFGDDDWGDDDDWDDYHERRTVVGLDMLVGLEYTFREAPFSLALDYKPAFNFIGHRQFWADGLALSIRFNIN